MKKGYYVTISVHDITNKILWHDPNYIVDQIILNLYWPCDQIYHQKAEQQEKCGKESSPYRKGRINPIDELWKTSKIRTIRRYQDPAKHTNNLAKEELFTKLVNGIELLAVFIKNLHVRCLTWFWIGLWKSHATHSL